MYIRRSEGVLDVLCTFNLRPVSTGTSASVLMRLYDSPVKHQPHNIVKHTQTICRLLATNCLSLTILRSWRLILS